MNFVTTTMAAVALAKTSSFFSGGNYNVGVNSSDLLSADAILTPV